MISGRSRAPGQHTGEDDVHDLDDPLSAGAPADEDQDDDESGPAVRGLRRRLLASGVLGVVALVGALLGTLHADARAAQAERELRLDTALRTGAVSLDGSSSSSGGLQLVTASVPLVNTSAEPVSAALVAVEAPRLGFDLTWACHPASGSGAPQTSSTWLPDGRLRVHLVNGTPAGAPVKTTVRTSGGVEVTSSPPLPLVLAAGDEQAVVLTARVDCSVAADGSQSAVVLSSEQPVDGGAAQGSTADDLTSGSSGDGTPYGTSGWLVRQVALACG